MNWLFAPNRGSRNLRLTGLLMAMGLMLGIRVINLETPLLDHHPFRQTQTALTAYWFLQEGVTLPNYPLPVLGSPWTAPMECPTYQLLVCAVAKSGVTLDFAARLTAVLVFIATSVIFSRLYRLAGASLTLLAAFLGFCIFSPFAIVWSRACMIDFTSVLLNGIFLAGCYTLHRRGWSGTHAAFTVLIGVLGVLTKVTSAPVFWVPALCLACLSLLRAAKDKSQLLRETLAWTILFAVPLAAMVWWTIATDEIKAQSIFTQNLTSSALRSWNFGTITQRLLFANWSIIGERIASLLLPWTWPFALLGIFAALRAKSDYKILLLGSLAGSFITVILFFPLYLIHDYYLCAVAPPLWLLTACGIDWSVAKFPRPLATWVAIGTLVLILARTSFGMNYVLASYVDWRRHEVYQFCQEVKSVVPATEELIVIGDDWNSRIPYYSERKSLAMADAERYMPFVKDYQQKHQVNFVAAVGVGRSQTVAGWPQAEALRSTAGCTLFRLP